jgi:AraC-like DNA-binding protein
VAAVPLPSLTLRRYPGEVGKHDHRFHQIIVPLEGALAIAVDRREERLDKARAAVVGAHQAHAFQGVGENRFLVLDVHASSLEELEAARDWLTGTEDASFFPIHGEIHHFARAIAHMLDGDGGGHAAQEHAASLLLLRLAEHGCEHGDENAFRMRRAVLFIERHFAEPIRVADVAAAAGLRSTQLHVLFKTFHGVTPMAYIAEHRLDFAESLLARGRCSIAEIALRAGYADQASLTRAMRSRRGVTPAAFRRRAK